MFVIYQGKTFTHSWDLYEDDGQTPADTTDWLFNAAIRIQPSDTEAVWTGGLATGVSVGLPPAEGFPPVLTIRIGALYTAEFQFNTAWLEIEAVSDLDPDQVKPILVPHQVVLVPEVVK